MRPLLVGEAPTPGIDAARPFSGRSGASLARLLGVEPEALPGMLDLANLIPTPLGSREPWPAREARRTAEALLATDRHRVVLLAGRRVAVACGEPSLPWLAWCCRSQGGLMRLLALVPHPSGRNRLLNDPAVRERTRRLIAAAIEEVKRDGG